MDVTNASDPQAGGQLSGETARAWAIKRLKKREQANPSGAPRPGAGLVQSPLSQGQSSTPLKKG
jgi:hypothetical protein